MSHSSNSSSCCCCETEKVCRLKVERSAKVGNNLSVGGNTITEGSLLPHRYVRVGMLANQEIAEMPTAPEVVEFTRPIASNSLVYTIAPGQLVNGFTVPQTGIYGFKASIWWQGINQANARSVGMRVRKANTVTFDVLHFTSNVSDASASYSPSSDSAIYFFEAGDFVQVIVTQDSGTQLEINANNPASFLEITQLR
jgi:hypothetical protein